MSDERSQRRFLQVTSTAALVGLAGRSASGDEMAAEAMTDDPMGEGPGAPPIAADGADEGGTVRRLDDVEDGSLDASEAIEITVTPQ